MAIRYIEQDRTFWLDTEHTSYLLAIVDQENFVGHVYYGKKLQYTAGTPAPLYLMRTGEIFGGDVLMQAGLLITPLWGDYRSRLIHLVEWE